MKSCLVVDDSRVIRTVARRILEGLEFRVDEAANGNEAIESCRAQMPDAILLDWNMPEMSGIEFLRQLRNEPSGEGPVVVFCTSETELDHIRTAMTEGANEYIMKPFDSEILQAKLTQVGLIG